jgi:F-type H+-transporting ATPase subunit b
MHAETFFTDSRSWVAIAFVIFFVLLGRKIWTVLTAMLDKRADAIRAELAEAQRLRHEAEVMLADANARREVAMTEAQALLEGAKGEAGRLAAAAEVEAKAAAERRERMAMERIAAAEKAAVDEVRSAAAAIAGTAAERVIRQELTPEADGALIDHAIGGLPNALGRRAA